MKKLTWLVAATLVLAACKKEDPEFVLGKYDDGILVLNEGLFQQNNASVTFYNAERDLTVQQVFYNENERGLGDLANDWATYSLLGNDYVIIAVDLSSQIEVVNARNFKSVAQIPVFDGSVAREPRRIEVVEDKAYSINYDGTVSVIDLYEYTITNTIQVGANPDGSAIVGNYLYTANSGGLNWPDYDSTISVVNLVTETEDLQFESRVNCTSMIADAEGDIYVISNGNYGSIAPAMLEINTETNSVENEYAVSVSSWTLYGDNIYYHDSDLNGIYRFNTVNETFENVMIIDCSSYSNMYSIHIGDNMIITTDAEGWTNSSTVRIYNMSGTLQHTFTAGFVAKDVIF